jgi:hypothetical protein
MAYYTETVQYVDSAQYANVAAWQATHAYTVGQIVRESTTPGITQERCAICVVAGTTASTDLPANIAYGTKVTDGTVTWQECTGKPAVNGDNVNTSTWKSGQDVAYGTIVKNVANTHYFICTITGTGGTGSEPSWNTTTGATTTDGSATWTCLGAVSGFTTKWAAPHARLVTPINGGTNTWLFSANMTVFFGDDHNETYSSGTYNISGSNCPACSFICVDHTAALPPGPNDLRTTGTISNSGGSGPQFSSVNPMYVYGLTIACGAGQPWAGISPTRYRFERCTFSLTHTGTNVFLIFGNNSGIPAFIEFVDCTFHFQVAQQYFLTYGGTVKLENCSFTGTVGGSGFPVFVASTLGGSLVIEGCDLSSIASGAALVGTGFSSNPNGYFCFKDCKIPAGILAYVGGDASMRESVTVELVRCDSGGTAYRNERHTRNGTETTSTAVVRTNGAADGATSISHKVDVTANALFSTGQFSALPLAIWNTITGSNRNVTLYGVANDSRIPNNDEFWFDTEYLGSGSSPQGSYSRGSKSNLLAAAAALTADTSAWDGAATARANSTAYVVGDVRKVASNPGRIFICTTAGTSASSEPGGYASATDGGSVTDGTAVFRAGCRFRQTLTLPQLAPAVTWNPADATINIGLSNGNLSVGAGFASLEGVRSTRGISVGSKGYFEDSFTSTASGNRTGCGILPLAANIGSFLNTTLGGLMVLNTGDIYYNGGYVLTIGSGSIASHTVCCAIDMVNYRFWARVDGGIWNNSGTANPTTNTGGIDISSLFTGVAAYPLAGSQVALPLTSTGNFGATTFAQAVPSGFTAVNNLSPIAPPLAQVGYLYVYPKFGRASVGYYLDPFIALS